MGRNEERAMQNAAVIFVYTVMFALAGCAFFPLHKAVAFGFICSLFAGLLNAIYQEVRHREPAATRTLRWRLDL